jgi:anthraniloyl-CoA monooxygenase
MDASTTDETPHTMRVHIIGGGPGGSYAGLLLKKAFPDWEVTVFEKNAAAATYGWGIVLPEKIYPTLEAADEPSHDRLVDRRTRWEPIDTYHRGERVRCAGYPYTSVMRTEVLEVLQGRCADLGVDVRFETDVSDPARLASEADLLVGADGVHSPTRERFADGFGASVATGRNRFSWFGTDSRFDALSHVYVDTDDGLWHAGAYPGETSTFIVSCAPETYRAAGVEELSPAETRSYLESVFEPYLGDDGLRSKGDRWREFDTVSTDSWVHENVALLGDAAHTAHFTIGSGTRMALADAVALVEGLEAHPDDLAAGLAAYEAERRPAVERLQRAAARSRTFFERVDRYADLDPLPFALLYLTRTGHFSLPSIRDRAPGFVDDLVGWFARTEPRGRAGTDAVDPPARQPFDLGGVPLRSRLVARWDGDDRVGDAAAADAADLVDATGAGLLLCGPLPVSADDAAGIGSVGTDGWAGDWRTVTDGLAAATGASLVAARDAGTTAADLAAAYAEGAGRAAAAGFDLLHVRPPRGDGDAGEDGRRRETLASVVEAVAAEWPDARPLSVSVPVAAGAAAGRLDGVAATVEALRPAVDACALALDRGEAESAGSPAPLYEATGWLRAETGLPTLLLDESYAPDEADGLVGSRRCDLCAVQPAAEGEAGQ